MVQKFPMLKVDIKSVPRLIMIVEYSEEIDTNSEGKLQARPHRIPTGDTWLKMGAQFKIIKSTRNQPTMSENHQTK